MKALTRHFFQEFFRLSFLDEEGEDSFRRAMIGILAGFAALGLWLPRIMAARYAGGFTTREAYLRVALADQLLIICLSMFIVGFAMALVVHSLFPDELDYRILMPLPVERSTIFSAKIAALVLYASLFIVTTSVAFGVPLALVSRSDWTRHYWPVRALSHVAVCVLGSLFAVALVIGVQGLVTLCSPRHWLRRTTVATQTMLVCALITAFPLALRSAAGFDASNARAGVVPVAPPVWFLGIGEVFMGNREVGFVNLAAMAVAATATLWAVTAACYAIVYRRFDQVIVRTHSTSRLRPHGRRSTPWFAGPPAHSAVASFSEVTLRRSGVHQLVFLGVAAVGFATGAHAIVGAPSPQAQVEAAKWVPFVAIFASVLGLQASLLLPVTRRAAWVFRITEDEDHRPQQIAAAERMLIVYGVLWPAALIGGPMAAVLGPWNLFACMPVVVLMGTALVEMRLWRWHRIPFTCSYLPGKRPVAHSALLFLCGFVAFTWIGADLLGLAVALQRPPVGALALLAVTAGAARWLRIETARNRPLEFEDELPESTYGLRLNS
jgi:hypothetical protein